jgi:hypothetical protein
MTGDGMDISDELNAFIESRFKRLLIDEKREQEERKQHLKDKGARKKRIGRKSKKELEQLEAAKHKGWIQENQYQIEKDAIKGKAEESRKQYRLKDKERIKPYGKTHYGPNSFICLCWYLIQKETNRRNSSIAKSISNFLKEKDFKKSNKSQYQENDIQRIIYTHEYTEPARSEIESYFDFMYSEFKKK